MARLLSTFESQVGATACRGTLQWFVCPRVRCVQRGRGSGGALSGTRSRGTARGARPWPRQHLLRLPSARRPRMVPAIAPPNPRPCHLGGVPTGGMPPWELQGGSGARGRRAHSRSSQNVARHRGVEAVTVPNTSRCPASVARRTRAPLATCRSGLGTREQRATATCRERLLGKPELTPASRRNSSWNA